MGEKRRTIMRNSAEVTKSMKKGENEMKKGENEMNKVEKEKMIMRSSAEVARSIEPGYFLNYYGKGVALTSENAYWNSEDFTRALSPFHKFKKGETTFLDLGAGTGAIVKLMQDYGYIAKGYELNEWALQHLEPGVEVIERDITEKFDGYYDVVLNNAFMYFSPPEFDKFFKNNRDNFGVLVFYYPFEGNKDKYRVNAMTKYDFADIGARHGLVLYEAVYKFWAFVKEENL